MPLQIRDRLLIGQTVALPLLHPHPLDAPLKAIPSLHAIPPRPRLNPKSIPLCISPDGSPNLARLIKATPPDHFPRPFAVTIKPHHRLHRPACRPARTTPCTRPPWRQHLPAVRKRRRSLTQRTRLPCKRGRVGSRGRGGCGTSLRRRGRCGGGRWRVGRRGARATRRRRITVGVRRRGYRGGLETTLHSGLATTWGGGIAGRDEMLRGVVGALRGGRVAEGSQVRRGGGGAAGGRCVARGGRRWAAGRRRIARRGGGG